MLDGISAGLRRSIHGCSRSVAALSRLPCRHIQNYHPRDKSGFIANADRFQEYVRQKDLSTFYTVVIAGVIIIAAMMMLRSIIKKH